MIYSRKMSCHSALLINIVGIIIYFYGLSCAQESQTTYVGKGVPVRINGRDFQLFTLPDGKRVLMLVTQDGGQQKVQTISNVNTRGNSAGNVKYRKLPGEKRKVLFKIQRQLTKILKRRINPRKYRLITSTDGIPRLALNRRRRGGLTFENIRKLIKLINSYLLRGIPYNDNTRIDERTEQNIMLDTKILTHNQIVQTEGPINKINDENVRTKIKSVKINQTLPLKQELHKENIIDKLHKEEKDILNTLSSLTPKKTTTESVITELKVEEKQIISDLQALNTAAVQSLTTSKIKPTQAPVKNITTLDSVLIHSTKVPHHLEMNNPHKLMTKLQDEERRILLRINHLDKTVKLKTPGEGLKSSFVPKNIGLRAHPKRKTIADLKMEEKLLLMQLQKLRQPGEITTEGPIPVSNHGIHTMTSPTQQEERRLDRILSSFNVLLSTIEKEKIVQMLYALDAGVGKGVGVRNDEIDVILRKLRPSLDPGDYEHLLHLLGANGYRIQNIKPTVSSLESIFLSTLQNAKGNLPKDVQDLLEGIKHLLTKEEDDEINKLIIETNGIISPSKEDMSSILAEAANAAAKKASGQPGHHITLVSKVKALFLPNTLPNIVSQVQKEVGSSQTNSLLQQIETLLTSHQKQSAVSQTETNSLLAAIETAIKSKPIPSTQQVHTNQLTDVLKSIQHMLTPPQQNNLQAFLGGQIMAPLPTIPQNNFFGNPMMVRPMNTMDSLLMQNLILGDTTDPPDPTDPPPPNCTKGCKHQPEIEAEDLPPTTTTQATTTIRTTTKKPTPSTAKPSSNSEGKSELALLSKSVIDALKSAQLPGNVKVELHLPKSRQKTTTTTTTATSVSKTENMIKQSKINGIGQLISGRILNDQTGVVHIINSQDTHQSSRSVRNKSNRGRFRLRIPPFEERMKTSEAIRSHAMESNVNQQSPFSNKKGNDKLHNVLPNPTQKSFVTNPPKKWWMSPKQKELSLLDKKKREDINDAPIIDTLILNDQYSQVILPDQFNPHKQMSNTKFTKASQWNKDDSRSAISLLNDDNGRSWRSNAFVRRNEDSVQTTMSSVSTNSNGYPPTWSSKIRSKPFFIQDKNKFANENYQNTVTDRTRRPKIFLPTRLPQPSREMNHLFGDGGTPNQHEIPVGRRSFIRRNENFEHTTTPSFFRERNYFGNEPGTVQRNEKRVVNHIKESIPYKDRNIFLPTKIPVDGHNLKPKRNVPHGGNEISSDHNFHQNTPPSVFSYTTPPSIFHRNQIVLPTKITYDPVKQPKANVVLQRLEKGTLLQQDAIKTGHQYEFKQPKIFQLRNSNGKFTKDIQQNVHSNHLEHQSHGELKRLIAPQTYFSDENNQQANLHNSVVDDNVAKHPAHETQGHLEEPSIPRRMPPHPPEFREPPSPRSVDDLAHLHHVQYEIPMTKMNIKDKLNQNTGINHGHSKNKLLRPLPNYLKVPTLDQNANLNSDFTPDSAFHSEKGTPVDLHKNFNAELVYSTTGPQIREKNGFLKHQENRNNSTVETNYHEGGLFGPPPPPPLPPMASNRFYETTTSPMHHFIPTKPPKLDWLAAASGGTHNSNDHHHQHRTHQHHKRAAELAGKYIGDSLIVPIASKSSPYYHLEHKKKDVQSVNDNFGINNSLFNIKAHFPIGTMKESSLTLTELRHGAIDKHRFMTSTILPETMLPPTYPKRVLPPILDKVMHDQSINKTESANGHKTWKYMLADAIKKKNLGTVTKNKNFGPPSTTISNDKQSTSFWNTLMKKINVEAPTLASNDGRPPVIHIHLPPPFTTIETTTKMPSMMPITEAKEVEPIEAEDTTTTAKPTTSAVPSTTSASPSYKLQIHTDENGVNKISIIQEAPVNTSKQIDNSTKTIDKTNSVCSPKSPLFYCQGVDVFQNVSSISAWCVGKCIQGECVKSVCNCSCHAAKTEEDSMHDDIALLFKGTGKEFSTDLVKMFKGLYDSLKGAKSKDVSIRPAETKQPKKENVTTFKETNGPNEMKSLLSSIERLIDAKLHQSGFNNKGPEEVEAEDVPMGSQNSGNGNADSVNSVGHEQNYQNNQNTQNSNFGPPDGGNNNWNNNNNNNNNNGRNNWGNDNGRNNWNNNNNGPNGNWNNNNNNNFSPGNNWQNNENNGNNGWNNGNNGWNRGNSNNGWSNGQMGNWNSGPPPPQMPWQGNSQQGWGGPSMSRGPQWNPWMSGPQGWQRGPQSMWGPGSMGMGMGMGGGMWGMGFGGMGKSKGSGGEAAD